MADKLVNLCDICGDIVYPHERYGDLRTEKVEIRFPSWAAVLDLDEKCADRLCDFFERNVTFPIKIQTKESVNK